MNERVDWLAGEPVTTRQRTANALSPTERAEFAYHWEFFARPQQVPPPGDWRIWLVLAGRGFGKTRAGSEWVRMIAESDGTARIALISSSLGEARAVMVEGESGIIACCPPERRPLFEPSLKRLRWANGAQAPCGFANWGHTPPRRRCF